MKNWKPLCLYVYKEKNNAFILPYIGISTSTSVAKGNIWWLILIEVVNELKQKNNPLKFL